MKIFEAFIYNLKLLTIFSLLCFAIKAEVASAEGAIELVSTPLASAQTVTTWSKLDANGRIAEAGVIVPYSLIATPPDEAGQGPAGAIVVAPFPESVKKNTFLNHFELNWEEHGHEPPVFMVPHFDFHFYAVEPEELMVITVQDSQPPGAEMIPAGYIYPGPEFSVPQMGVHAVRPADLEKPFRDVLIFGFYGGKMTFVEPMVTRDHLLTKQPLVYEIPHPASIGRATLFPTRIDIRFDGTTDALHLTFSGFVDEN